MKDNYDVDSLDSAELEKELERQYENMKLEEGIDPDDVYNQMMGASTTSFKSMMSGATVMTNNQMELNKMVGQDIKAETNLDDYLDKMLAFQKNKNSKLETQFQANNEDWKNFR
jgi:hypothetical protein